MTATAEPPVSPVEAPVQRCLDRAEGVELLGGVNGSGYKEGAALVRRGDGQMVQLGTLMYGLLESVDGRRDVAAVAARMTSTLGRRVEPEHVLRIADKLARQGLLAGTEHKAPPRRNPLLALRWKVLVTDPTWTRRLTAPLAVLFRPWIVAPVLAAFVAVFWFVLVHHGVAAATAEAFHSPGLLLLVFALAVVSAGFHELGHAAACQYGGATPGGMGIGLYLVWPAFYTDVTDSYRLPRRDRLRVDLGGLYFNAVVAVITLAVWLAIRADALLLLVALQVLQMVKQLSPVIRADGYHILADATGVPDLYAHIGPTLRRLLPRHRREPSALTGRARLLVTLWVLIVVPVLFSLSFSAILLLPRLVTTAWDSGQHIVAAISHQADHGQIIDVLASLVRLLALTLPVVGSALVTQKILRTTIGKARSWSGDDPVRRTVVVVAGALVVAGAAWAWWPSGQYQPVRAGEHATIGGLGGLLAAPQAVARPVAAPVPVSLAPGTHLAVAMVPVGGATRTHPALFIIPGAKGRTAVAIVSGSTPPPHGPAVSFRAPGGGAKSTTTSGGSTSLSTTTSISTSTATTTATTTGTTTGTTSAANPTATTTATTAARNPTPAPSGKPAPASPTGSATAFPFTLPAKPGPGGTRALAVNTTDGGVTYDVAYTLVTVGKGAPVTNTNGAYALADCHRCTTVAVSFQVVLIVGQTRTIAPINVAGAFNADCPACVTTAIADQIVVTLRSTPSGALLTELRHDLQQLNALPQLGAGGTPAAIARQVAAVQQQIDNQLAASGLLPPASTTATSSTTTPSGSGTTTTGATTTGATTTGTTTTGATTTGTTSTGPQTSSSATTTATAPTTTSTSPAPSTSTTVSTTPTTSSSASTTATTTSPSTTATTTSTPATTNTTNSQTTSSSSAVSQTQNSTASTGATTTATTTP